MLPVIHLERSGGGSGTGWQGQVEFRSDLPITLGNPAIGDVYLVEKPTTILLGIYTTYQSGLYIRDFNNGNLNDWRRLNVKVKFTDSEFAIVNAIDQSKQARFDVSLVAAAATRIHQLQDKNGVVAHISDIPSGDELYLVKTSATDTTPGYLNDEIPDSQDILKLVGPPPPGGDEKVTLILRDYNKPWTANVDPTENDDNNPTFRHRIGQIWVNILSGKIFAAASLANNAAVWKDLTEDHHSGFNLIQTSETVTINVDKEMVVSSLIVDGSLIIDGNLTLIT